MTLSKMGTWISTFTGKRFDVMTPRVEDVCIDDIAHALSLQTRFGGHSSRFYSVAQHSVLASKLCTTAPLWALLHDSSEAYIGDMVAPLKHSEAMAPFRAIEEGVMNVIMRCFGLPLEEPAAVRIVDRRLLLTEARDLGIDVSGWYTEQKPFDIHIDPWPSRLAEAAFLDRFYHLTERKVALAV